MNQLSKEVFGTHELSSSPPQYFSTVFPSIPARGDVDHSFIKAKMFLNRDFLKMISWDVLFLKRVTSYNATTGDEEAKLETLQKKKSIHLF